MYQLLIRLMLLSALIELGINISDVKDCRTRQCIQNVEKRSRDVLKVKWKPISVFPEEAKRFSNPYAKNR